MEETIMEIDYSPFDLLPDEIIMKLFRVFPFPEQIIDKRLVCRRWAAIIRTTPFGKQLYCSNKL
jgi:hypothetical protein